MAATTKQAMALTALRRRLDAIALGQLRAEATRLAAENDDLRSRLADAEDDAEFWRREATEQHLQLCEAQVATPGITQDGRLVALPKVGHA